jgi:hypothetical protein
MAKYNEAQKNRYLELCKYEETTKETIKMIFSSSAKVEAQFEKDLAEFNRPQVIDLLKSFNSKSRHYLTAICIFFADYYNWCLSEGLVDITNVINQYDSSLTKGIIEEIVPIEFIEGKYFIKQDVLEYLDKIPDPRNKFIMYAIFSGVKGEDYYDLTHLRMENLHEKRKVVELENGRMHPVDDLFIRSMKEADSATAYYPDGVVAYNKFHRNEYDKSVYVLKSCRLGTVDTPINRQIITVAIALMQKQTGNKFISVSTLYKNGLISFIKEHYEQKGISFETALLDEINGKLYTYDKETEQVIKEFGSQMTVRMLRLQLKDILHYYI